MHIGACNIYKCNIVTNAIHAQLIVYTHTHDNNHMHSLNTVTILYCIQLVRPFSKTPA